MCNRQFGLNSTGLRPRSAQRGPAIRAEHPASGKLRSSGLSSSNSVLITDLADLSVREVDLEQVFRGSDNADRFMRAGIEDFGSVRAVFVGGNISVVALYVEGEPV